MAQQHAPKYFEFLSTNTEVNIGFASFFGLHTCILRTVSDAKKNNKAKKTYSTVTQPKQFDAIPQKKTKTRKQIIAMSDG